MPIAYAVTYIFGTIGSAMLLAQIGPWLLRIDLAAECKRYEAQMGGGGATDQEGGGWHQFELRAYRVKPGGRVVGMTVTAPPKRWCPTPASSSSASGATARSWKRPRTWSSRTATSSRSPARREVLVDIVGKDRRRG